MDDSQLIHSMYRLALNRYQGCTIVGAMNGREALDVLAGEGNFDLILLDINMPVMNGIQFLEEIRRRNIHRNVPIVVISTEGKDEDTLRALKLGAWGYIVKPFRPTELYEMIERVIANKPPILDALRTEKRNA